MNQHTFYGEIKNQIASELFKNPNYIFEIHQEIKFENEETVFTLCSEAARIFYSIQNLSNHSHSLDLTNAVNQYSNEILNQLLNGKKPSTIDLITIASKIIQVTLEA